MKLTDKYISNLKHLDKDQFFSQEGVEGLTLRIYKYPSTAKTWFYQYRPKGKSSVRIKIGSHHELGINQAISRAKKLSNDIFMGKDPHEIRQGFKGELTLGEQLKDSYKTILTSTRYSEATITTIKNIFGTYIFRKTHSPKIREVFSQLDNIQHIKVSSITNNQITKFHQILGARTPTLANRIVEYLRMFYNIWVGRGITISNTGIINY